MAESYSTKIDTKPHNAFYDRPSTLSLLPELDRKWVLDAGCGPGKYAEILMTHGARVVGLDLSPKMIEMAIERNQGNGEFKVYDIARPLPFRDKRFDVVLSALVLNYIHDWDAVFSEFHRVLKPLGVFVFSISHPFFDYLHFKAENYFQREKVSDVWNGFGEPIVVESYRRSLMDCISPLTENGFSVNKIIEPLPVEEFERYDPKNFQELNKFPSFLSIRAIKGG